MRPRHVSVLAVIVASGVALLLSARAPGSADHHPAAASASPSSASSSRCAGCHASIAREWAGSLHRRSFSDPLFQAGYRVDHRAFCRDCHAPGNDGTDPRPGSGAHDDGITCAECHTPRAGRAHPTAQPEGDFGRRECGACHQFAFPAATRAALHPSAPMQRTVDEWRASGRTESCVDCHMPRGASAPASHAFTIDRDTIAGAIAIRGELVARPSTTDAILRLSAVRAGHAVPTGDVLRTLELSVWPASAPDAIQRRSLTRVFGTSLGFDRALGVVARTVEREDTRIPPRGAREERFAFDGPVDELRYRLEYLHVNRRQAAIQGVRDEDNRLVVAEGVILNARDTRSSSGPRARSHARRPRAPRATPPTPR